MFGGSGSAVSEWHLGFLALPETRSRIPCDGAAGEPCREELAARTFEGRGFSNGMRGWQIPSDDV